MEIYHYYYTNNWLSVENAPFMASCSVQKVEIPAHRIQKCLVVFW